MTELTHGRGSHIRFDGQGLAIHLSAELFLPDLWASIKAWFASQYRDPHWLSEPFRVMSAEEDTPGSPRWKQTGVDVLSWLLFHLLVPVDHRLVKLWQAIDWAAINRLCAPLYRNSRYGQRAWAPAQLFALLMLFFVLPVNSECGLLSLVALAPLYRWFCGLGLFTKLPDHSTLHTFRKRVDAELFEAILTLVVLRCLEAGLIGNQLTHFDMMGSAASARAWTPYERAVLLTQALLRYLEASEQESEQDPCWTEALAQVAIEVLDNKRLKGDPKAAGRVAKSVLRWQQQRQAAPGQALWELALEEAVQTLLDEEPAVPALPQTVETRRSWLKKIARRLKAGMPHARGDLDARVGWTSNVRLLCGYWLGFLVDGLRGVITAVQLVPLSTDQRSQLTIALEAHQQRLGAYPAAVAADSAQDFYPVHQALDECGIQGHIASRDRLAGDSAIQLAHFTLDTQGQLLCPAGKIMIPGKTGKDGRTPYRTQPGDCAACRLKASCLPKAQQAKGRRFLRLRLEAHQRWLENRTHTRTEAYRAAQKQRFASEGWFGLAVRLHQADKMPYRSEPMNHLAGLMIGIVMNLVLLTRHQHSASPAPRPMPHLLRY